MIRAARTQGLNVVNLIARASAFNVSSHGAQITFAEPINFARRTISSQSHKGKSRETPANKGNSKHRAQS